MYFQGFPGTPQVEMTTPVGGKVLVQLGPQKPFCKDSELEYYKIQGYKAIKLERLLATRLSNWKGYIGYKAVNLILKCSLAWWPLKGPADDGKRPPGVMDVVFGIASRREVF